MPMLNGELTHKKPRHVGRGEKTHDNHYQLTLYIVPRARYGCHEHRHCTKMLVITRLKPVGTVIKSCYNRRRRARARNAA